MGDVRAVAPGGLIGRDGGLARHASQRVCSTEAHWPWMQNVCTWAFRYPKPQNSYGDYFTFVSPEFVAKPIYDALKAYTGN